MQTYEGAFSGRGLRVGIVASRFNEAIVRRLLDGALDCLTRHDVTEQDIAVAWVPGAFEIPLVAQRLASSGEFDAVVALGTVIRGETPHFDHVASQAASGVTRAALTTGVPVTFGVLTTDDVPQAEARAGGKAGNKGFEAALAALEMANLMSSLPKARTDL